MSDRLIRANRRVRERLTVAAFLAPTLLLYVTFILSPLVEGLALSFFDAGLGPVRKFIGLENFIRLTRDERFLRGLMNTGYLVGGLVPLALTISLTIALLIHPMRGKAQSFYRLAFYLPGVAGGTILALVWAWIYNPTYGLLNWFTGKFGIAPIAWTGSTEWALPALGLVVLTWILGQPIILFLAGLSSIPAELMEAGRLDGAGPATLLRRIQLPLLKPTTLFVLVTQTIGAMQIFVVVHVLTRGGPANATQTLVYRIYETVFDATEYGYASAMGVVLLGLIAGIAAIQFRLLGREVDY